MTVASIAFALILGANGHSQEGSMARKHGTLLRKQKASRQMATEVTDVQPRITATRMHTIRSRSASVSDQSSFVFAQVRPIRMRELVDEYRDQHLAVAQIAETSRASYEISLAHVRSNLGHLWTSDNYRPHVVKLRATMAPYAWNFVCYWTGRLLRLAVSMGLRAGPHDLGGLTRIKTNRRTRVMTLGESRAALKWLAQEPVERRHAACTFMLLTGWRTSEVGAIEWGHVDADEQQVYCPKTKAGPQTRTIGADALAVLERMPRVSQWVFPGRWKGPLTNQAIWHFWHEHVQPALGFGRDVVPHVARHTVATRMAQLNIHPSTIAAALGHSDEFQQARYQHCDPQTIREAHAALERKVRNG